MTPATIQRPRYFTADLKNALRSDWRGFSLSEKMDGVWTVRTFGNSIVTGEAMRDGEFFGFDLVTHDNQDLRRRVWRDRREALIDCAARYGFRLVKQGSGSEFVEAVLRDGGEGCVAKPFEGYFGVGWQKIKRAETFDCRVEAKLTNAVLLTLDGEPAGKCQLAGRNFEAVRVGDIVEVEAMRRNASGNFREPKILRIRRDKMEVANEN